MASNTNLSRIWQAAPPVAISITGLLLLVWADHAMRKGNLPVFRVSGFQEINDTVTHQGYGLLVSAGCLALITLHGRKQVRHYFRLRSPGDTNAAGRWQLKGPLMALTLTLGTAAMMAPGVTAQHGVVNGLFWKLLPLVIILAAANAWTEEIITRLVLVAGLDGKLPAAWICLLSGLIFGMAHYQGTPGGLPGMLVTGILGAALAKSVMDTHSLRWALLIHFLLDLVIFSAGAMILAGYPANAV